MRLSDFEKDSEKDKTEIVKQQRAEITKVLCNRVIPKENHTLFEIDLKRRSISVAEFKPPNTIIYWHEALEMFYKKRFNKLDIFHSKPITKAEVIKKENCIYIPALNRKNVVKILLRDYNIKL